MSIKSTRGLNKIKVINKTSNIKIRGKGKLKLNSKKISLKKRVLKKIRHYTKKKLIYGNLKSTTRKINRSLINAIEKPNNAEIKTIESKSINNSIKETGKVTSKTLAKNVYRAKAKISKRLKNHASRVSDTTIKTKTPLNNFKSANSVATISKPKLSLKKNINNSTKTNQIKLPFRGNKAIKKQRRLKKLKDRFLIKRNRISINKVLPAFNLFTTKGLGKVLRKIITSSFVLMLLPVILIVLVVVSFLAGVFGENNTHKSIEMDLIVSKSGFAVPVANPVITSHFGWRAYPLDPSKTDFHTGIDFGAEFGEPVFATLQGKVKDIGYPFPHQNYGGYDTGQANYIILDHGNGIESAYWHLKSILVSHGEIVEQGAIIGTIGSTGYSTGSHLHFEIRDYNIPMQAGAWANQVDPFPLLFGTIKDQLGRE